jgi:hypothetical protein
LSAPSRSTAKRQASGSKSKMESKYFLDKKKSNAEVISEVPVARTSSFSAMWAGQVDSLPNIEPHTLILGTHPSTTSLKQQQYYAHPVK